MAINGGVPVIVILAVLACKIQTSHSLATLRIQLKSYSSGGKDWKGDDCDGWITANKACDPKFTFCLDKANGDATFSSCEYADAQTTDEYQGKNTVTFSSKLEGGRVDNPLVNVIDYQGLKFKIEVYDDDSPYNGNDLIDRLYYTDNAPPDRSEADAQWKEVQVYGIRDQTAKSMLKFSMLLYCEENYYSGTCAQYCLAQDSDELGHYTCDPDTGEIVCRPGWEGVNETCTVKIDDCESHQCQNGASCVDQYKTYTCDCPPGYTGERCEVDFNECLMEPNCFNNGTCEDGVNLFNCLCPDQYTGDRCEHHVCDVTDFCLNGGTCFDDDGDVGCICPVQFTGRHCDVDKCQVLQCANGGNCTEGVCECAENYIGALCDVDLCDHITCAQDGQCVGGYCLCPQGYTGRYCHVNVNECERNLCQNESTCVDAVNGYTCRCLPSFSGIYCEDSLSPTWQNVQPDSDQLTGHTNDTGPRWVSGIVITILAITIVVIIILVNFIRYKRRLKQQRHDTTLPTIVTHSGGANLDHFSNPLYVETAAVVDATSHPEKNGLPAEYGPDMAAMSPPPYSLHAANYNQTLDQQGTSRDDPVYAQSSDIQISETLSDNNNCGSTQDNNEAAKENAAYVESDEEELKGAVGGHSQSSISDELINNDSSHYDSPKNLKTAMKPQQFKDFNPENWTPVKQPRMSRDNCCIDEIEKDNSGFIPDGSNLYDHVAIGNRGVVNFKRENSGDDDNPYSTVGDVVKFSVHNNSAVRDTVDLSVHNNSTNEELERDEDFNTSEI